MFLLGALVLASRASAEPRNLSHDLADKKNLLEYVALREGYHQTCTAYIRHNDTVWLEYDGERINKEGETEKERKKYVHYVLDSSYISSVGTQKTANIIVTAEHYGHYDALFEKILEEFGIPDKEINSILVHEALNKVAVVTDISLDAELLRGDSAYILIFNVPNGSGVIDGKLVLSDPDKKDNELVQSLKEQFKNVYGLR